MASEDPQAKQSGIRVFKKSSPNGKITVYLGKRDFYDYLTHCDPIDGVVLVDPEYLKERKVFIHVLSAFRYGREHLDVLGLAFRKDLFLSSMQVYPRPEKQKHPLTKLQERLIRKLGENACPFFFELPKNSPSSVTLQPAPEETGQPCGVDYELRAYVGNMPDDNPHKRNSIRLLIRKLTYAPEAEQPQPSIEQYKDFLMSSGNVKLEASLEKEKYIHGEPVLINVCIDNNSSNAIKKLKVSVIQIAEIVLFNTATYKCPVAEMEVEEGFPIQPGQTGYCKRVELTPLLANNRDKQGLALDGQLKHEDTNLASSTIFNVSSNFNKESLGIIVQYKVKLKLGMGFAKGELVAELPFTLTHLKPEPEPAEGVDASLIDLDTSKPGFYADKEDDLIFEDFARLRLKGHGGDEADA